MGKHGKKQSLNHRRGKRTSYTLEDNEGGEIQDYPMNSSSAREVAISDSDQESQEEEENQGRNKGFDKTAEIDSGLPSKFSLYQQSVQVSDDPFC